MEMMEDISFTMVNEEGKEVKCDVLFTFDSDETGKSYVVYTDNTTDEDGYVKVFASIFTETDNEMQLSPIETDEEWAMVQSILDEMPEDDCDCEDCCHDHCHHEE
ncbi:MAG: DUF1292 domain-containing protein [Clostridia bacterium]|nr:DUF1292 domain-containing protein [Clostridia bacterium]